MTETTTIVSGQTVFFHELSDVEMDSALQTLPTTQVKILVLAGQGLSSKEICGETGIKTSTLTAYKKQKLFHDRFYTMAQLHTAVTTATVKKVAQADALDSYLNIRTLATVPPDATAAEQRVALSANETILRLAGSFESEAVLSPAVSIGQILVNLDREHGRHPEPWADALPQ